SRARRGEKRLDFERDVALPRQRAGEGDALVHARALGRRSARSPESSRGPFEGAPPCPFALRARKDRNAARALREASSEGDGDEREVATRSRPRAESLG